MISTYHMSSLDKPSSPESAIRSAHVVDTLHTRTAQAVEAAERSNITLEQK